MTAEQIIARLQADQGDSQKLALATVDIVLSQRKPELRDALEVAAIPHWFTGQILAQLLNVSAGEAQEYFEQLQLLPMVEPFPARQGWNVHEATRLALRQNLALSNPGLFKELSASAASSFVGDRPFERLENLYHLFVASPSEAEVRLFRLSRDWKNGNASENLLTLGPILSELSNPLSLLPQEADFQRKLALLYVDLGDLAVPFGQSQLARFYFEKASSIDQQLLRAKRGRVDVVLSAGANRRVTQIRAVLLVFIAAMLILSSLCLFKNPTPIPQPKPTVTLILIPPAGPGGANTRVRIAGKITGAKTGEYILLYSQNDVGEYWIQPRADQFKTPIEDNGNWSAMIHEGESYAAFLVKDSYQPKSNPTMNLPSIGGDVLARDIKQGL